MKAEIFPVFNSTPWHEGIQEIQEVDGVNWNLYAQPLYLQ
jgi:hypothetical protein